MRFLWWECKDVDFGSVWSHTYVSEQAIVKLDHMIEDILCVCRLAGDKCSALFHILVWA